MQQKEITLHFVIKTNYFYLVTFLNVFAMWKKYKILIQPNLTFLKTFRNSKLNKIVTSPYKIVKIKCFTLIFVLIFFNKLKKLKKQEIDPTPIDATP